MRWARTLHSCFKVVRAKISFRLAVVVAPLLLSLGANICVGYQVRSSLVKSSLGLLILILGCFATIVVLAGFVLLRFSILGFVRLGVFDDCVHELSYILDRPLESAKFVDQGLELAVPLQDDDGCLGCDSVRRMDYFCNPSWPAQGRLSFLLDTMLKVDDRGGSPACALEVLDEFFLEIRPGGEGIL